MGCQPATFGRVPNAITQRVHLEGSRQAAANYRLAACAPRKKSKTANLPLRLLRVPRVKEFVGPFAKLGLVILGLFLLSPVNAQDSKPYTVEIDLRDQTAYLVRGGRVVLATPIASGRYGHLTPTGSFKIVEKERNHYSSMYGKIVDARGNTVV